MLVTVIIVGSLVILINLAILGLSLKLYTEIMKEKSARSRKKEEK